MMQNYRGTTEMYVCVYIYVYIRNKITGKSTQKAIILVSRFWARDFGRQRVVDFQLLIM